MNAVVEKSTVKKPVVLRKGAVVNCQYGLFGEKFFSKNVPTVIEAVLKETNKETKYLVRKLGLCVMGIATVPKNKGAHVDLYCPAGKFVGYFNQQPYHKDVKTDRDARFHLEQFF